MRLINYRVSACVMGLATMLIFPAAIAQRMSALDIPGIRGRVDTEQLALQGETVSIPTNQTTPLTAEEYVLRGIESYKQQDYEQAIADYEKAIELNPKFAEAYYNRGVTLSKLGEPERAIADYNKAIELNSDYTEAYLYRGNDRFALGDKEGAIEDYNKVITLDPDNPDAYYNRGNANAELGDLEGAIADYDKAIELNPDHTEAYFYRGLVLGVREINRDISDPTKKLKIFINGKLRKDGEKDKAKSLQRLYRDREIID